MNLDEPAALERADPHGACRVLAEFPEQCRRARTLRPVPPPGPGRPRLVLLAGMGGSAAGADLVAACAAASLEVPLVVHRGYGLPAAGGHEALVLASSYSGNTVEVLSAVETALGRGLPVIVLTAGGRLGRLATDHGLPRVTLPGGLMPRMALGYLVLGTLAALRACGVDAAAEDDVSEALDVLTAQAGDLGVASPVDENEAKRVAQALHGRLPVIYGGPLTGAAAYRWKTDLEENGKVLAVSGAVPEMNHNEIEAWWGPAARDRHVVLLREEGEGAEIGRRMAILRHMVEAADGSVSEVCARGRGRLARLLSLVYLGQWASVYLAALAGVDPWTVPRLEEMKRRMAAGGDAAP
ncbi:MAG TPA: bifunctional phosphoglucose/phosphomannose isomerase [Acidimicrobiia bacterium]